ncbi:hypothetical protein D915_004878 [Fasciola hepatica]|uniref:Uncharacterized protein n=1 Tax=Fasciola hepatica TaxID=6192 RepID=A0A4E0R9H3_FASHE|nr:hypothetical protein D915_004878 [Fasciola hepatica]
MISKLVYHSLSVQYSRLPNVDTNGTAHGQEVGYSPIAPIPTSDHDQGRRTTVTVPTADVLEPKPEPVGIIESWTQGRCSVTREDIVPLRMNIDHTANISLVAANGEPIQTTRSVAVTTELGNQRVTQQVTVAWRLPWDVILGVDFLSSHGAVIDLPHACISIDGNHIPFASHAPTKPELQSVAPMDMLERLLPHPDSVETEAREKLKLTLADFTNSFAWDEKETGQTGAVQHYIDTGDSHPVCSAPRRIPIHYQQQLEDLIDGMLERKLSNHHNHPGHPLSYSQRRKRVPHASVSTNVA